MVLNLHERYQVSEICEACTSTSISALQYRRCPPAVLIDPNFPAAAHRATVLGVTEHRRYFFGHQHLCLTSVTRSVYFEHVNPQFRDRQPETSSVEWPIPLRFSSIELR